MFRDIAEDYRAIYKGDPAIPKGVRGFLEVVLCTPGFQSVFFHRFIHILHNTGLPVLPRFLSLVTRWWTGIEIHPGAKMGRGVFIDHGSGVVIGETAIVGDGCTIYQGVTLGATGNETTHQRHPILGKGVFVGSGARILGPIEIGDGARIGANAVVLDPVLPGITMVGVKARPVKYAGTRIETVPGGACAHSMQDLGKKLDKLEAELAELKKMMGIMEKAG